MKGPATASESLPSLEQATSLAEAMWNRRDPRVRGLAFQSTPSLMAILLVTYMALVIFGPRLMRRKSPAKLTKVMAVYNIVQVSLSAYMFIELLLNRPRGWSCAPMDLTRSKRSTRIMNVVLLFHFSKLVDFLDTLFLVLKKDFQRMSYLHVFHHASMFFNFWLATLFTPGDPTWMEAAMNSFVHCIMYSYYFLAALGPGVRKHLWWKRYLTQLQLVQFVCMLSHLVLMQTPGFRCHVPIWALGISFVYVLIITCFFINFYVRCYRKAQKQAQAPIVVNETSGGPEKLELSARPLDSATGVILKTDAAVSWTNAIRQQHGRDQEHIKHE